MNDRERYNLTVINLIKSAVAQGFLLQLSAKKEVTKVVIFYVWGICKLGEYSHPGTNLEITIRGAMEAVKATGHEIHIPKRK